MTERPSAAQSRAPAKAAALAALIASAVIAVQPLTSSSEGEVYRAYPDSGGVWTICKGHTGPEVHAGLVASKAQCAAWYRGDMTAHMEDALRATPELAEQRSALQAAGDFSFNAGGGWWRRSPMAAAFAQRRWRDGCEAFRGFITRYRSPRDVPGRNCRRDSRGVWFCQLPGLVTRRENERAMCLAGLAA